jgi:hypothetical protein
MITDQQREFLYRHIDGPVPVPTIPSVFIRYFDKATSLQRAGLIRFDDPILSTRSFLTTEGREMVARLLAKEADELYDSQFEEKVERERLYKTKTLIAIAKRLHLDRPAPPSRADAPSGIIPT